MDGTSGEDQCLRDQGRRGMEATGLAHGPVVAKKEGNASGAKGPWAVAGASRIPVGTLWPSYVGVNERVELWSKPGGSQRMRAIA